MADIVSALILFVVSLLVGGFGLYVGGRVIADVDDYSHAVITAFIGAVVWTIVAFFFAWIPLLGPLLVFLAYLWVINTRYPGGWVNAILITVVAWATLVVVLVVLSFAGLGIDAFGVPGV